MLASGIALGVLAGLALGGRLGHLAELRIAWWPLLAVAVALRLAAPALGDLAAVGYVLAFTAIVAVAVVDRTLPGMTAIALGATANLVVVAANGGMPVDASALVAAGASMPSDRLHVPLDASTRLAALADFIPVPVVRGVYSPGDVLLAVGGFWLPFTWLRRP